MEKYFLNKASNYLMKTYSPLPIVLVGGKNSILYDSEGKSYIDFTSGIGVNSLGYGDEEWVKAIQEQVLKIAHTSNIFYNIPSVELAEKLVKASKMSKVFFGNSGAEANEGAIKLARKYSFDKYGENRSTIITLKQSFHGRTIATLSATGQDKFHNYFFPFTGGFKFVQANNYEELEAALDSGVCAVMMEAIQGEGGIISLESEYVKKAASKCSERDILLIFDEVQCGIGRTGHLFGFNYFDVEPDIVTIAKGLANGLPIGAVLCNGKLENVLSKGDHGSTFGGNALAAAAALTVMNRVSQEGFLEAVRYKETIIKDYIQNKGCSSVAQVRGKGLMIGIEIKGEAAKVQEEAMKKGVLVLTAGPNVIRLLPPLIIEKHQIEEGLSILLEVIKEMEVV